MHAWVRNKSFETDIECMKIWPLGNRLDNFQYINRIYKDIFTLSKLSSGQSTFVEFLEEEEKKYEIRQNVLFQLLNEPVLLSIFRSVHGNFKIWNIIR